MRLPSGCRVVSGAVGGLCEFRQRPPRPRGAYPPLPLPLAVEEFEPKLVLRLPRPRSE